MEVGNIPYNNGGVYDYNQQSIQPAGMAFIPRPIIPPTIPPGLQVLYDFCGRIYPDQLNPLQVSAVVKFWLGGPDPLDYISMYYNKGDERNGIAPHWHYISFGLSDLHGDGRVHQINTDLNGSSGFGFELTFRLKKEPNETSPPTWPAAVMQALAKYVFQTGNILCSGDHVSWHCPLDNSESRIQHMLMSEDSQLGTVNTYFGTVSFIQIVGACFEELQAAQQWNGLGIIDLMKSVPSFGGDFLITDMRRGETIFEIDPELRLAVDEGIASEGSNLSGVSARCSFITENNDDNELCHNNHVDDKKIIDNKNLDNNDDDNHLSPDLNEKNEEEKRKNDDDDEHNSKENTQNNNNNNNADLSTSSSSLLNNNKNDNVESRASRHSSMSVSHDRNSRMSFASETGNNTESLELIQTKYLESLHLKFNYEAGTLLPLALRGRLKHGRHFTFKNVQGDFAITFVTVDVDGSFVNTEQPYALHGPWLQVLIPNNHIEIMLADLENVETLYQENLPITYEWEQINLKITLFAEE